MHWRNQTFRHLTTHRNWQTQTTHRKFQTYLKTILKWSTATIWYIGMYTLDGTFSSRFIFHLVQNVYHEPGPPASGHLVFIDLAHSRSLSHPSVKSRGQTQSKLSLMQKTAFLEKKMFGNTFKICAPCLGFKDLYQRMGNLPFHINLYLLPPGPEASLDPMSSLVLFSC